MKSETTIGCELKAVQVKLRGLGCDMLGYDNNQIAELYAVQATLQWILGKPNLKWTDGSRDGQQKSVRPLTWITDRSGHAVD